MGIKVFWLEPAGQQRLWLRRFTNGNTCPLPFGYHTARVLLADAIADDANLDLVRPSDEDVRWPTHCDCGYAFQENDERQLFNGHLYRGAPDGQLYSLQDAPPGAMWDASWYRTHGPGEPWTGPDGISLVVKLPNGNDWTVDAEASNCTRTQWGPKEIDGRQYDKVWLGRSHYCWVRHGDPRTGNVHVDKNGDTCAAGAGSILSGDYHGFLHNGELTC